jgi:hypothetical protein
MDSVGEATSISTLPADGIDGEDIRSSSWAATARARAEMAISVIGNFIVRTAREVRQNCALKGPIYGWTGLYHVPTKV